MSGKPGQAPPAVPATRMGAPTSHLSDAEISVARPPKGVLVELWLDPCDTTLLLISRLADHMISSIHSRWTDGNLLLRPFEEGDVTRDYLSTLNDKEYMRFSQQQHTTHTPAATQQYLVDLRDAGGDLVACINYETETLISTVSVRPGESLGEVWMGLMTLRGHAGKGAGLQAWSAVVRRLCASDSDLTLRAGTHRGNVGMQRILSRSLFLPSASDDEAAQHIYFYRRCKAQWASGGAVEPTD